ncbi:NAD(P)/FAD-dependent oxidoreductase [Nocardia puris]|uniref:Flavin-dependent dehydrogenase n=1 Tax=Nocardia puris TaxID=208602 RepID=A0A366E4Q5_9NOCA|nr:FAD-dependent oxidoreductase [Nocardia puris]RBO96779.1 flavin-dependent dehydrogenase [Nocardia puris]
MTIDHLSTAPAVTEPARTPPAELRADVCVVGAGIVGLFNALQYAKRDLSVVLVDEITPARASSYKVGESLLVFSNALLRSIAELDEALSASLPKSGIWMTYGLEGNPRFDRGMSEWAFQSDLPERYAAAIRSPKFRRTMFADCQIVRPEIEEQLRERVRATAGITFVECGRARQFELSDEGDHTLTWRSQRKDGPSGTVRARWIIDCSGRSRLLAKTLGHDIDLSDGFETASVWAQFSGCTDADFGPAWQFHGPGPEVMQRDRDTVHLWGDGYWIWLIRLVGDRISVGVSFDKSRVEVGTKLKEYFWDVLERYPLLDFLDRDNVLEYQMYRNVQLMTDTHVSPRRYAMAGDAASIIDAYYSQGISLALLGSWHTANIVDDDINHGRLDTDEIAHVDNALRADWRIMRAMIRHKYQGSLADGRFFLLEHLLDYSIFGSALLGRFQLARWLHETGGRTAHESAVWRRRRQRLQRQVFLSQSLPWRLFEPDKVASAVERMHERMAARAERRLRYGTPQPPVQAIMRVHSPVPALWRLFAGRRAAPRDLTMGEVREPAFLRMKGTEFSPLVLRGSGTAITAVFLVGYVTDAVGTWISTRVPRRRAAPSRARSDRSGPRPAAGRAC